ncbi:MAG: GTPase domain-containing protein [Deltaproteobacteria bacterium]|nr:GTPase domain-containing protein [Deltaproteobacteria bacterium]
MAFVNRKTRELNAKIVYVGAPGAGKTQNLRTIAKRTEEKHKGEFVALGQGSGKTNYFEFIPIFIGRVRGFHMRLHLYALPGRSGYAASRRMIMKGADAVVFVADSDPAHLQDNLEWLKTLRAELGGADVPVVFQFNKRDLHNAISSEQLKGMLGVNGHPAFEAVATQGYGVLDTLKAAARTVLDRLAEA